MKNSTKKLLGMLGVGLGALIGSIFVSRKFSDEESSEEVDEDTEISGDELLTTDDQEDEEDSTDDDKVEVKEF